jgi:hypothetical protein
MQNPGIEGLAQSFYEHLANETIWHTGILNTETMMVPMVRQRVTDALATGVPVYNIQYNNCQHVAYGIIYGCPIPTQAERHVFAATVANNREALLWGTVVVVAIIGLAYVGYWLNKRINTAKEEENRKRENEVTTTFEGLMFGKSPVFDI